MRSYQLAPAPPPEHTLCCSYSKLPQDVEQMSLRDHVLRSMRPREVDPVALDLLLRMLSLDPGQRPSARACLEHSYFSSGVSLMTAPEFRELTHGMPMSHEYAVKQDRSRSRAGRGAAGAQLSRPCALVAPWCHRSVAKPGTNHARRSC